MKCQRIWENLNAERIGNKGLSVEIHFTKFRIKGNQNLKSFVDRLEKNLSVFKQWLDNKTVILLEAKDTFDDNNQYFETALLAKACRATIHKEHVRIIFKSKNNNSKGEPVCD